MFVGILNNSLYIAFLTGGVFFNIYCAIYVSYSSKEHVYLFNKQAARKGQFWPEDLDLRVYRSGRREVVDEDGDRFPAWIFSLAFLMPLSTPLAVCTIETENSVRSDEAVEALGPIEPIGAVHELVSEKNVESLSTEMSLLIRRAIADLVLWLQLTEEAVDVLSVEVVK